ncbi:MAG: hypothetical protein ABIA92_01090 [Patescibacteria group bacterium]
MVGVDETSGAAPAESQVAGNTSGGTEEAARLAQAAREREQARKSSMAEGQEQRGTLRENAPKGVDQPVQENEPAKPSEKLDSIAEKNAPEKPEAQPKPETPEVHAQDSTKPESKEKKDKPGAIETATASVGNYFEKTMKNAQKIMEHYGDKGPVMKNVMQYGVPAAAIAVILILATAMKKGANKIGVLAAAGLLSVGAAFGINKYAETIEDKKQVASNKNAKPQEAGKGTAPAQVSEEEKGAVGSKGEEGTEGTKGVETLNQSVDLLQGSHIVEVSNKKYNVEVSLPANLIVDGKNWKLEGMPDSDADGATLQILQAVWSGGFLDFVVNGSKWLIFSKQVPARLNESQVASLLSHLSTSRSEYIVPPEKAGEEELIKIVPV